MTDEQIMELWDSTPSIPNTPFVIAFGRALLAAKPLDSATDELYTTRSFSNLSNQAHGYDLAAPSQPTVPVCRLLTAQQSREAYKIVLDFSQSPARARAEVQRKFCEVNGLTLAAPKPKEP
jgi:hypothetical protein